MPSPEKEQEKRERESRRARLRVGRDFRPYDLFNEFGVIPLELLRCNLLTPLERLGWVALSRRLGREGKAFPSYETLGHDVGVDRHQAMRIVRGLERKQFLRKILRPGAKPTENTSNEYRLVWHAIFAEKSPAGGNKLLPPHGDRHAPPGSDKSPPLGSGKLSPEKNHHHQKKQFEKSQSSEKEEGPVGSKHKPESTEPGTEARVRPTYSQNLDDDDYERMTQRRQNLDDPEEEFRVRLRERDWLNGPIQPEGIVQTVQAELNHDTPKWKRFLEYEAPLTTPEEVRIPGAHYRTLLKNFRMAEDNTRIERQREKREKGSRCPDGKGCQNGLIQDENGVPVELCICAKRLSEKDQQKRRDALREAAVIYAKAG